MFMMNDDYYLETSLMLLLLLYTFAVLKKYKVMAKISEKKINNM